jgi:hypothetical protein
MEYFSNRIGACDAQCANDVGDARKTIQHAKDADPRAMRTEALNWPSSVDLTQSLLELLTRDVSGDDLTTLKSSSELSSVCSTPNVDFDYKQLPKCPCASASHNVLPTTPSGQTTLVRLRNAD